MSEGRPCEADCYGLGGTGHRGIVRQVRLWAGVVGQGVYRYCEYAIERERCKVEILDANRAQPVRLKGTQ